MGTRKIRQTLDGALSEFKDAMLQKFLARAEKQRRRSGRSVTDEDFNWETDLDPEEIESHLREEILEWLADDADKGKEDIDLANMAFLDWMARRGRAQKYKIFKAGQMVLSPIPGKFGGCRPSKIFGRLDCKSGMRMRKENRVFFLSAEDAVAQGYRPCKNCKPLHRRFK